MEPRAGDRRELLARILAGRLFRRASRQRELLEYLCCKAFALPASEVHEQHFHGRCLDSAADYQPWRARFGVQHELPAAVLLEADYAGNHAVRLNITRNLDWVQRQFETAASDPALRIDIDKSSLIRGIRGRPIDAGR